MGAQAAAPPSLLSSMPIPRILGKAFDVRACRPSSRPSLLPTRSSPAARPCDSPPQKRCSVCSRQRTTTIACRYDAGLQTQWHQFGLLLDCQLYGRGTVLLYGCVWAALSPAACLLAWWCHACSWLHCRTVGKGQDRRCASRFCSRQKQHPCAACLMGAVLPSCSPPTCAGQSCHGHLRSDRGPFAVFRAAHAHADEVRRTLAMSTCAGCPFLCP